MGTRNLTIVVLNNMYKVAQYCQWDGYPTGQGQDIAEFIIANRKNMEHVRHMFSSVKTASDKYVEQLWKSLGAVNGRASMDVSDIFKTKYPEFHRDTGAQILNMILTGSAKRVQLDLEFAADSVFCEWVYVIDLDSEVLEIYTGFNKRPVPETHRFYFLQKLSKDGYYPVKLYKKIKFKSITHNTMQNIEDKLKDN